MGPEAKPAGPSSAVAELVSVVFPELGDIFGQGLMRRDFILALHHHADLLDHIGIRKRRDIAHVLAVRNRSQHATHDLARARLGHVGHDVYVSWSGDLADQFLVRLYHATDDLVARLEAGFERDVD